MKDNPSHVVLTRMGDFFEAFDESAAVLSAVCNVPLTAYGKKPRKLAGVPYHAVHRYVKRLVAAGHRVTLDEPQP